MYVYILTIPCIFMYRIYYRKKRKLLCVEYYIEACENGTLQENVENAYCMAHATVLKNITVQLSVNYCYIIRTITIRACNYVSMEYKNLYAYIKSILIVSYVLRIGQFLVSRVHHLFHAILVSIAW